MQRRSQRTWRPQTIKPRHGLCMGCSAITEMPSCSPLWTWSLARRKGSHAGGAAPVLASAGRLHHHARARDARRNPSPPTQPMRSSSSPTSRREPPRKSGRRPPGSPCVRRPTKPQRHCQPRRRRSRDEAGYCGWKEAWTFKTGSTGRTTAVKVELSRSTSRCRPGRRPLECSRRRRPNGGSTGAPRPRAGPREARPRYFDGFADKILGKTVRQGRSSGYSTAQSGLAGASKAYGARKTGNPTRPARSSTRRGWSSESSMKRRRMRRGEAQERRPLERKPAGRPKASRRGEPAKPPPSRDRSQVAESSSK